MSYNKNYFDDITILFVDDEDGVRDGYNVLLNMWAKKAYCAKDGKEGLEFFKRYKPDIVITDIKMPTMNGIEMIKNIRNIDLDIPIIITTAHQEPELLLDAVELQVDGYIIKPISKKELKKRLKAIAKIILFERERTEQYNILRTITDTSLEAILVYKGDICVNINNIALKLFGFSDKSEIIDKENFSLQSMIKEKIKCDLQDAYEILLINKLGKKIPVLIRCKNLTIGREKFRFIVIVDLTYIKKLEEESKKRDQILQHQSKLASMGEMIGSIAHQWRQPLNTLNVNIENLEYDYEDGVIDKEFLDKFITQQTDTLQYMSKTIDDFSNFFRIDKQKAPFSVKKAVEDSINIQLAELNEYDITLNIKGDDFIINGFENEFLQVMINLISNAIDAIIQNEQKDGLIEISLFNNSVIVTDNGGGIPSDIIERIFEPYYTTKEQGKGTGMGLYMSKMIIEDNMDGKISITNIDGGAKFTIVFIPAD